MRCAPLVETGSFSARSQQKSYADFCAVRPIRTLICLPSHSLKTGQALVTEVPLHPRTAVLSAGRRRPTPPRAAPRSPSPETPSSRPCSWKSSASTPCGSVRRRRHRGAPHTSASPWFSTGPARCPIQQADHDADRGEIPHRPAFGRHRRQRRRLRIHRAVRQGRQRGSEQLCAIVGPLGTVRPAQRKLQANMASAKGLLDTSDLLRAYLGGQRVIADIITTFYEDPSCP